MPLLPALIIGVLLARIDMRTQRLPDPLVAALAAALVLPTVARPPGELLRGLAAAALVATVGFLSPGLGLGDVKLAGVLAYALGVLGWPAVLLGVIVLPLLIAGPAALAVVAAGRRDPLPFGPPLLAGALLAAAFR